MSLALDGVWKGGLWAPTVWADGVWYEPAAVAAAAAAPDSSGGRRARYRSPPLAVFPTPTTISDEPRDNDALLMSFRRLGL